MLTFKNKPNQRTLRVAIAIDCSYSMRSFREETVNCLNQELESLRKESQRTGIPTEVTLLTFNDYVNVACGLTPINKINEVASLDMDGNTALHDATYEACDRLHPTYAPHASNEYMYKVLVITDGQENRSRYYNQEKVRKRITDCIRTDTWTFAFAVPPGAREYVADIYNIPIGCVTEWESSAKGMDTLSTTLTSCNTALFTDYSKGVTRSVSYFSPDLNNLPQTVVNRNLDNVTGRFSFHPVTNTLPIRDYVSGVLGKTFRVGQNFYQLTKTEEVQNHKDIILRNKNTSELFTGDGIRSLLRLPEGVTVKVSPASSNDYEIYVRSTSWNRKLVNGTNLLIQK